MIIRFSTPRTFLSAKGVQQLDSRSLVAEIVIGRDLCRFISVDLAHVPAAQRRQALVHQVETASPWGRTDQYAVWRDGVAQVWLWDQARIEQVLMDAGMSALVHLRLKSAIRLPETVFLPSSEHDGVIGQACGHGWEVLHWKKRTVHASRWYPERPQASAIGWFLRSQGLDVDNQVELLNAEQYLSAPWPEARPSVLQWLQLHKQAAFYIAGMLVVLFVSLQLSAGARWWWMEKNGHAQAANLQASADDLLRARGQARRELVRYTQLLDIFDVPGVLTSQWLVTSHMPQDLEYKVVVWERVGRNVEMVIAAEVSDTLGIVRALTGPGIADVSIEPWRKAGHYSVKLRLTKLEETQSKETPNALAK